MYKLIDVVKVKVFPVENVVRRELMLIKVKADDQTRSQIVQIATIYRGNVLDVYPTSLIIELTGDTEKLRGFVDIMKPYGVLEIAKTGITAMSRGDRM
nr:acetolactate synthase small subunit [uncultured Veillonella sp.]